MIRYILKRLMLMIPVLAFVIFIVFMILNVTPGNPGRIILGVDATQEQVEELNEELGINKPVLVRYFNYLAGVARLDFGESYRSNEPVFKAILTKYPITLMVALISIVVATIIGIPIGVLSAVKQYSTLDTTVTVSTLTLASIPSFFLGIILILIFGLKLRVLPTYGVGSYKHMILPVFTIALPAAAYISRITRTTMLEVMRQDYIRTAKAKGATQKGIVYRHALKNALLPVITVIGMIFANLLGGVVIIEVVFGIPGIGQLILTSINNRDIPMIMGSTILLATSFMVIMLFVDIIYSFIDPRVKAQFE